MCALNMETGSFTAFWGSDFWSVHSFQSVLIFLDTVYNKETPIKWYFSLILRCEWIEGVPSSTSEGTANSGHTNCYNSSFSYEAKAEASYPGTIFHCVEQNSSSGECQS